MKKIILTILSIIMYTMSYSQGIKDSVMIICPPGYIVDSSHTILYSLKKGETPKCFYYLSLKNGMYVYMNENNSFNFLFVVTEDSVYLPKNH